METSSDDEVLLYKCRLCPGLEFEFTATERDLHQRQEHPELSKLVRKGQKPKAIVVPIHDALPQESPKRNQLYETQEKSNQSAPLNIELPLVFPGGQSGTVKLSVVVTLENGTPNAKAQKLSKPKVSSNSNRKKTIKSRKQIGNLLKKKKVTKKYTSRKQGSMEEPTTFHPGLTAKPSTSSVTPNAGI